MVTKTCLVWVFIGAVTGFIGIRIIIDNVNVPDSYHDDAVAMYNKFPERLSPLMKNYIETDEMTYHEYWKLEKEFKQLTRKNGEPK